MDTNKNIDNEIQLELSKSYKNLLENSKSLEPEFVKILNDHMWELIVKHNERLFLL